MIILDRDISVSMFDGNKSAMQDSTKQIFRIESQDQFFGRSRQPLCPAMNSGSGIIATAGTFAVALPDGYTNAAYLLYVIRSAGTITATVVSPDHATAAVIVYGTSTQLGTFSTTEHVTSISLKNDTGSACYFEYQCYYLPDITIESSFRGLDSTGARANVT